MNISWDISLKHKTWGVCENSPPLSSLNVSFCFVFQRIFAGRCLEDVTGESHAGCERIAGARRLGMYIAYPFPQPTEVTPKKGWIGILLMFYRAWIMGYPGPSSEVSRARKNPEKWWFRKGRRSFAFSLGFGRLFRGRFLLKPWEGIPWNIATTFFWNTKKWEVIVRISSCLV